MCYSMFGIGGCCHPDDKPGDMDFYQSTNVPGRLSSLNVFSRMCANNPAGFAANGRQIEPQWSAKRPKRTQQRHISQSIACLGSGTVFQQEGCQPFFVDEKITSFGNLRTRGDALPVYDPSGDGWAVHSASLPEYRASFDLLRNNCTFEVVASFPFAIVNGQYVQVTTEFGLLFRLITDDVFGESFLRLKFKSFGPDPIVLESVSGGATSFIAGAPMFGVSSTFRIRGSIVQDQFSAFIDNPGQLGSPVSTITATVPKSTATRFGISVALDANFSIDSLRFQASDLTDFVSAYSAAGNAALNGSFNATNGPTGYGGPLVVGADVAWQDAVGGGNGAKGPSDTIWSFYSITQGPLGSDSAGEGFGQSAPIGTIQNPFNPAGIIGGIFWGGREFSSSAHPASKAWLTVGIESFVPSTIGWGYDDVDAFGKRSLVPIYRSKQELGKEVIGAKSKYGWPNCCGVVIDSISVTDSRTLQTPVGKRAYYKIRAEFSLIAGPLSFQSAAGNIQPAPTINGSVTVAKWAGEAIMPTQGPAADPDSTPAPDENTMRMFFGCLVFGFNTGLGGPATGFARSPAIWDCTPGMSQWICSPGAQSITLKDGVLDVPQDDPFIYADVPDYVNGQALPDGERISAWVFGKGTMYLATSDAHGLKTNRILGGFDFLNFGHGLVGGGAFNASDRFFYCVCNFDSEASAYAFSTADLTKIKSQFSGGFNTAPSLQRSSWAISYDGSIRYPLLAVDSDGLYHVRSDFDDLSGGLQGVDCIKDSSPPYSPPLANPTF